MTDSPLVLESSMTDEHQLAADIALQQLKGAAAAGCPRSMAELGIILINAGKTRGYQWLKAAADRGELGAHIGLFATYGQGVGVAPDSTRAFAHFLIASRTLGVLNAIEGELRAMLTPAQIAEAECLAAEWAPARH